jgi:AcrR family transcriptional regulator
MTRSEVPSLHPPSASLRRNDALVLDAMLTTLDQVGWVEFSITAVAKRAGVSQQTVQDRFRDRTALAIGAWRHAAQEPLRRLLAEVLAAHGFADAATNDAATDHSATANRATDPERTRTAWRACLTATRETRAGNELLFAAPFDPALHEAITTTLGAFVQAWTRPRGGAERRAAAQRAYLIARALGLLAVGRFPGLPPLDPTPIETALATALTRPARAGRAQIPDLPAPFDLPFDTGDPRHDALLRATNEQIAQRGFHDASLTAILTQAGASKGYLFNRYPSKTALFLDATRRRQRLALAINGAWLQERARRHGQGRAEAALMQTVMHPDRARERALASEEFRLSLHTPALHEDFAAIHESIAGSLGSVDARTLGYAWSLRAVGEGLSLLPLLDPEAWRLPFEVVLAPLTEELERVYLPS